MKKCNVTQLHFQEERKEKEDNTKHSDSKALPTYCINF